MSSPDLEVLRWLAECQRNRYVAVSIPDEVRRVLSGAKQPEWARELCHLTRSLEYEPRSLAVSPDGRRVAAGTKAGKVHLARWKEPGWEVDRIAEDSLLQDPETRKPYNRAIRALCFLGPGLLVVGGGPGLFTVLDFGTNEGAPVKWKIHVPTRDRSSGDPFSRNLHFRDFRPDEDSWLLRFVKILPLFPPGSAVPAAAGAPLAFGVTQGRHLHVLSRYGNESFSTHSVPENLFGKTFEEKDRVRSEPGREPRIIDGEWWGDRLWLLDSRGRIHRLRWTGQGPLQFEKDLERVQVPYFRPRAEPRSISLCGSGVGIRFGEDVTFLPWTWFDEEAARGTGEMPWVEVPGATRCITVQEFGTNDWAYLAVATSRDGVRWIPWKKDPTWRLAGRGGQRSSSSSILQPILEMALVRPAPQAVQLVLCTRDHKVHIASLLDKRCVVAHLEGENPNRVEMIASQPLSQLIASLLTGKGSGELERYFFEQAEPGVALRLLRQAIHLEFKAAYGRMRDPDEPAGEDARLLIPAEVRGLLETLDLSDLPGVVRRLGMAWKTESQKFDEDEETALRSPPGSEARADVFRKFCLWTFQRAARIDEGALRDLARVALETIEDLRQYMFSEEWQSIGLFGGFLRKWFEYGHTYQQKQRNLLELVELNRACHRDLDALFYLTRVLRSRVDTSWSRTVEPTEVDPGVWEMASPPAAPFFLHSHTDGRIFATSRDGRPARWRLDGWEDALSQGAIHSVEEDLALCHADARLFRQRYRYGPYARSLYIEALPDDDSEAPSFLVVFGIRGWHPADLKDAGGLDVPSRHPRLAALEIRWENGEGGSLLAVRNAAVCETSFEPYAIARIPSRGGTGALELVVGTGGSSGHPFWEVVIDRGEGLTMSLREPAVQEDPRWRNLQFFPEERSSPAAESPGRMNQGSNPCWSAQGLETASGAAWLLLGMQDGRVRFFFRHGQDGKHRWLEGGQWHTEKDENEKDQEIRPVLDPILTYSPLRELLFLAPHGEPGLRSGPLFAYGTAEGVVGVVPLEDRLLRAEKEPARPEPGKARLEPNEPWVHLVHTRQKSAICGLADYRDGKDWNLAVLTESGRLAIFNLEPAQAELPIQRKRFVHRGLRLDHFLLHEGDQPLRSRALVALPAEARESGEEPPVLVVGGDDGTLTRYVLAFPKFSPRRTNRAMPRIRQLFKRQTTTSGRPVKSPASDDPYLVRSVGAEYVHPWLRLCPVGGRSYKNLLRFSLWHVLQEQEKHHLPRREKSGRLCSLSRSLTANAEEYRQKLQELADEVYDRKPFETEAAKILWSEAARYANKLAEISITPSFDEATRDEALAAYSSLLDATNSLSNRWFGADQEVEARVLMHSFGDLFDWPSLALLALDDSRESLAEARNLLLFKTLQYRLRHNDIFVPLETLRVINTAILRAIIKRERDGERWSFVHRPQRGGPGFNDLLALIGNLVRQQAGRLTPSDPLYTEVSKFLALSILLIPDGILLVGKVVSESRLAEHGTDVGRRLLLHAEMFQRQLEDDFGIRQAKRRSVKRYSRQPVKKFQDYLSRRVDPGIFKFPVQHEFRAGDHPWRRLLSERGDPGARLLTDRRNLAELRKILFTVARLAHLETSRRSPADEDAELLRDLASPNDFYYYAESREYLKRLIRQRRKLIEMLAASPAPQEASDPAELCESEIRHLDERSDLFEPQRSHYRFLLEQWRRKLDERGQEARTLVDLISHFNRHVYRTSADDLMASLTELALRSAPLSFPPPSKSELPLRLRIRDEISALPFVSELFRRGSLLVQGSHLATTLLHLANLRLSDSGAQLSSRAFTLKGIEEKAKEIAALAGVESGFFRGLGTASAAETGQELVPGDEVIWSTILGELARNVYDYCRTEEAPKPKLHLVWCRNQLVRHLAVGGEYPFYEALDPSIREESDTAESLLAKVSGIRERPGTRYQKEARGSFGFGLYFLIRLFKLLGETGETWAGLDLLSPEDLPRSVTPGRLELELTGRGFDDLRLQPLTMVFSWKAL